MSEEASDAMAHGIPVVGTHEEAAALRAQLERLGFSQRRAAVELEVGYREMRYWCAGKYKAPRCVTLALERLEEVHEENRGSYGGTEVVPRA